MSFVQITLVCATVFVNKPCVIVFICVSDDSKG